MEVEPDIDMKAENGRPKVKLEEMEKKVIVKIVQTYDYDWKITTYPSDQQMPVKVKVNMFPIPCTKDKMKKNDLIHHVSEGAEGWIGTLPPDFLKPIHQNTQVNYFSDKAEIELKEENMNETETSVKITEDSPSALVEHRRMNTIHADNKNPPTLLVEELENFSDFEEQSTNTDDTENFPVMSDKHVLNVEEQIYPAADDLYNEGINFIDKSSTLSKKQWKCRRCRSSFSAVEYLKKHKETCDYKKDHTCGICKKSFVEKYRLRIHMRVHTGERPFSCNICDKSYITKSHLNEHFMTHPIVWCKICKIAFTSDSMLKQHHCRVHLQKSEHLCKYCKNSFSGLEQLSNHLKKCSSSCDKSCTLPEDDESYNCEICDITYDTKGNFENHMLSAHNEEKPYEFNKSFAVLGDLRRHSIQHLKGYPYTCNVCPKSFKTEGPYLLHLKMHAKERELSCHICKRQFPLKRLLYAHLEAHNEDYNEEDKFVCHVCGEMFCKSRELFAHLYEHNVSKAISNKLLKRYYCHFCKKGYARTYSLFKHLKIHVTGSAPFVCDVCKELFHSKFELFDHFQVHDSVCDLRNPPEGNPHVRLGKNLQSQLQ